MARNRIRPTVTGLLLLGAAAIGPAEAQSTLPTGGHVVAGSATIGAPSGTALSVTQTSPRAVVNWNSFSVGQPNTVTFAQPNSAAAILNRVTGATPSSIAGQVDANGQVYLVNPNGIAITPTGNVQVGGGFVASTLGITNQDFMAGKLDFTGNGASAGVSNGGTISAGPGGYVGLIGGTAANSGTIAVPLGRVALGSGEAATLDLYGDGFMQVAVPTGATTAKGQALVGNSGTIAAPGGTVELKAATVATAIRDAVNMSGAVAANSASGRDGAITLSGGAGGAVNVTGTLDASAPTSAGNGGTIAVDGARVRLGRHAVLNASGAKGGSVLVGVSGPGGQNEADLTAIATGATILAEGAPGAGGHIETSGKTLKLGQALIDAGIGGSWLTDPTNLTIDATAATTIDLALNAGTSVTEMTTATDATGFSGVGNVATGAGDITVASALSWNSGAMLTLSAYNSIIVSAPITIAGGGTLVLTYNNNQGGANTAGALSFVMGQGSAQFTPQTAGQALFVNNGTPGSGNGTAYTLIYDTGTTATGIRNLNGSSGNFALAVPLDASSLGTLTTALIPSFSGNFNGLGNTISNLTIGGHDSCNLVGAPCLGLFGQLNSGGSISNLGIVNGLFADTAVAANDGELVGVNAGTIRNSYATGSVAGGNSGAAGGLVGYNLSGGTIANSYATATVSDTGLAGTFGGLAGQNDGTLTNVYATGAVTGGSHSAAGGLIGAGNPGATITDAYATGHVTGGGFGAGGLVAQYFGTITNGYYDSSTTGQPHGTQGDGSIGLTSTELASALPSGFSSSVWGNVNDQVTPYILTNPGPVYGGADGLLYNLVFTPTQLQAIGASTTALAGNYALAQDVDATGFAGYMPIGWDGAPFAGTFNGLGNVIANLAITTVNHSRSGVFGSSSGTLENVGVVGGSVTIASATVPDIGGLVGNNTGAISNAYSTVPVSGLSDTGGLVGSNTFGGTITNSYSTGTVISGPSSNVGGLAGVNQNSTITDSYATGSVTGGSGSGVGGLVGVNGLASGGLTDVYAAGAVSGGAGSFVGGLVGVNDTQITNGYWNSDRSAAGTTIVGDNLGTLTSVSALSGSQPFTGTSYAGFNFTGTPGAGGNNWVIVDGNDTLNNFGGAPGATMPVLASEAQSVIQNAHQLQLLVMNPAASASGTLSGSYTLGRSIDATGTGSSTGNTTGGDVWGPNGFLSISDTSGFGFAGSLSGLSGTGGFYTISNLTNRSTGGLFGIIGGAGTVDNLALLNVAASNPSFAAAVGGLAGVNHGTIFNTYTTGTISNGFEGFDGGLVGSNAGTIATSLSSAAVVGCSGCEVAGLVAANGGSITNSYTTGAQLVSDNQGTIASSYSTGPTSGSPGLIGENPAGAASVTNAYYDAGTTGAPLGLQGDGSQGLSTTTLQAGLPAGFAAPAWGIIRGKSYPYLCWMFGGCGQTPQIVSGTMYSDQGPNVALPGTPIGTGTNIFGLANGTQFISVETNGTVPTATNGYYYYLLAPNTLPPNGNVVTYGFGSGGATGNGAAMADQVNGAATGMNILADTLHEITPDSKNSTLQANLATAEGSGSTLASSQAISLISGVSNLQIDTSGAFDFDSAVNYASGTVTLNTGGPVTQSFAGTTITATALLLEGTGPVTLTGTNMVDTVAGSLSSTGNALSVSSGAATVTVGTVNGVSGVTTQAGDIALNATAGGLLLSQQVNAGLGNNVTLSAAGGIGQTGSAGVVTASSLTATGTAGLVALSTNANNVGTITGSGGLGFLFADSGTSGTTTVGAAGITAGSGSQISLATNAGAGGLVIGGPLSAPGVGNVALTASGGGISETAGGSISTSRLSATTDLNAGGAIDLSQTANAISGNISLFTGNNTGVSLVSAPVTLFNTGATALNAIETLGRFTVQSTGAITEGSSGVTVGAFVARTMNDSGAAITLGGSNTAGTVTLTALNAAATALASAPITYGEHAAFTIAGAAGGGVGGFETGIGTTGTVTLSDATPIREQSTAVITANILTGTFGSGAALTGSNLIANLGAVTDTGPFSLTDAHPLTVTGTVSVSGDNLTLTTTGTGSNLVLNANLTATGNTVSLISAGTITQPSGSITAGTLTGGSVGGTTLTDGNLVSSFGAWIDSGTGSAGISFTDGTTLTTAGTITTSGALTLKAVNEPDLILNTNLISGGVVTLFANGNINQTAGGITGTGLHAWTQLDAGGSITLNSATNAITGNVTLTSINTAGTALAGGVISFTDSTGFAIAAAPGAGIGGLEAGVGTAGGASLNSAGAITEFGVVTAATLTGSSVGGAVLGNANSIGTLGPWSDTGAGSAGLTFDNNRTLTTTGALSSVSGPIALALPLAGTSLTLGGDVTARVNTVTLSADGSISQGSGTIMATNLLAFSKLDAGAPISLNSATNAITGNVTLTSYNAAATALAGGTIGFTDSTGFTVAGFGAQPGIATAGAATIVAGGAIGEASGAVIAATSLSGSSVGGATFNQSNLAASFGPWTDTGAGSAGVSFVDAQSFGTSGTVSSASGPVSLIATVGSLTLNGPVAAPAGTATVVSSAGSITEASGTITSASLVGLASTGATLDNANQVGILQSFTITGGGDLSFVDAQAMTVAGTVGASGNVSLTTTAGNMTLNGFVGAGIGGTLNLVSAGNIVELASTPQIGAGILTGSAATGVTLNGVAVQTLGSFSNTTGNFLLSEAGEGLTVTGPVTTGNGGTLTLRDSAVLTLNGNVSAGAAGTVILAGAGSGAPGIVQGAGSVITAGTLTGSSVGGASMPNANSVSVFGPWSDTGAGSTGLLFTSGLTLATAGAVSSTGALTLSAGPDLILDSNLSGTTVTLFANGNINQTAGGIAGTNLQASTELDAGGSIALDNATNAVGGNVTLASLNTAGNALAGGAIGFTDSTGFTIASLGGVETGIGTQGAVTALAGGDLTIAAGAAATGNGVALSTPGNFVNNSGAAAVTATGGGRWLVYSNTPGGDILGNLDSGNTAVWGATYASLPPASVTASGNRYLFAQTQTLTVTTTNVGKTYGTDATAAVATAFAETGFAPGVTGAFLADTAANVVSGTPSVTSTGSPTSAAVAGSPYPIVAATGSLTVASGYGLVFANTGILTVNPAPLMVTASDQSKIYGQTASLGTTAFAASGLVGGDTVTRVTLTSPGTAATAGVAGSPYVITASNAVGTGLSNYTITYVNGALTVTPAPLTITASNLGKVYGDTLNFAGTEFSANGLVATDTVTSVSLASAGAAATAGVAGSPYAIAPSAAIGTGLSNYAIAYLPGQLAVTPRPITVAADDLSRPFDQPNPPLTFAVTSGNLVNGDSLLGGPATAANTGSAAGSYPITQGTLAVVPNYTLTFIDGTLVVTAPAAAAAAPLNFGVSPDQFIPAVSDLQVPQSGLTPCSPVDLVSTFKHTGSAILFGADRWTCGHL